MIKLFSGGKWSHVGMVLRLEEFDDTVLIWESTTLSNVADVDRQMGVKGVQLVPLSERIKRYEGDINVRQLSKPITKTMRTKLAQVRKQLSRRPYERDQLELLQAAYDWLGGSSRGVDLSSPFWCELVAEAYQAMGLLPQWPDGLPSNEYTPLDFSQHQGRDLMLLNDYELGPEIPVT